MILEKFKVGEVSRSGGLNLHLVSGINAAVRGHYPLGISTDSWFGEWGWGGVWALPFCDFVFRIWGYEKRFASEVGYLDSGPKREMGKLLPSVNMGHVNFLEAKLVWVGWYPAVFLSCKFLDPEGDGNSGLQGIEERAIV